MHGIYVQVVSITSAYIHGWPYYTELRDAQLAMHCPGENIAVVDAYGLPLHAGVEHKHDTNGIGCATSATSDTSDSDEDSQKEAAVARSTGLRGIAVPGLHLTAVGLQALGCLVAVQLHRPVQ